MRHLSNHLIGNSNIEESHLVCNVLQFNRVNYLQDEGDWLETSSAKFKISDISVTLKQQQLSEL